MGLLRKAAVLCFAVSVVSAVFLVASNVSGTPSGQQDPVSEQTVRYEKISSPSASTSAAKRLRPPPARAKFDKGPAFAKGCAKLRRDAKVVSCRFGKVGSRPSVALIGDSHALQYTPPLIRLAKKRGFELVTYMRGSCVTADVKYESRCDRWRAAAIRQISSQKPDVIVLATATGNSYVVKRGGKKLNRRKSERFLRKGMARTYRKLLAVPKQGGGKARVVLLRDQSLAPFRPPDCLKKNARKPSRCAFRTNNRPNPPGFDWAAAKRVSKVKVVQPMNYFCGKRWCPAVSGRIVVFRDKYHLSATYARTMWRWLGKRLGI